MRYQGTLTRTYVAPADRAIVNAVVGSIPPKAGSQRAVRSGSVAGVEYDLTWRALGAPANATPASRETHERAPATSANLEMTLNRTALDGSRACGWAGRRPGIRFAPIW